MPVTELIPGVAQAITVTFTGHPFDTVKTRLQGGKYTSAIECLKKTVTREGPKGLYRGVSIPLISHVVKRSNQFYVYEKLMQKNFNPYLIGIITGPIGTLFGGPLQVLKVNTQSTNKKEYKNAWDYTKTLYREDGIKGFYRGFKANVLKDAVYSSSFLGNYTFLKNRFSDNLFGKFMAGGVAHSITWALFIPIDYVKTQVQRNKKKTITSVVNEIVKNKSYLKLWTGIRPALLRIFPTSGLGMVAYEVTKSNINL